MKPGKYLKSEDNGHIFIYDEVTAKLPQMRVIQISEDEAQIEDEIDVEDACAPADATREDLEALFIEKFKRKPHPRMRMEKLRAAVEGTDGHDHSAADPE